MDTRSPALENDAIATMASIASPYCRYVYTLANFMDVESLTMICYSVEDKIGRATHAGAQRSGSVYHLHKAPHAHSRVYEHPEDTQEDLDGAPFPHAYSPEVMWYVIKIH